MSKPWHVSVRRSGFSSICTNIFFEAEVLSFLNQFPGLNWSASASLAIKAIEFFVFSRLASLFNFSLLLFCKGYSISVPAKVELFPLRKLYLSIHPHSNFNRHFLKISYKVTDLFEKQPRVLRDCPFADVNITSFAQ